MHIHFKSYLLSEQFLLLPQCFQKSARHASNVCMWERFILPCRAPEAQSVSMQTVNQWIVSLNPSLTNNLSEV